MFHMKSSVAAIVSRSVWFLGEGQRPGTGEGCWHMGHKMCRSQALEPWDQLWEF